MKTIKDFTPEIQAKIPDYIKKYTEGIFDGGRYNSFNYGDAEKLIHWNYEKCNFKKPCVLVAENPLEAQIYFNYIKKNQDHFLPIIYTIYCLKNKIEIKKNIDNKKLRDQLDTQLDRQLDTQLYRQLYTQLRTQFGSQLDTQLRFQLYRQLGTELGTELDTQLYTQLYTQLDAQLYTQLRDQLDRQLGSQLDRQLDRQLGKYNDCYLFTSNIYSNCYGAYFKFIKDEFKMDLPINIELDSWNDLYQKSNIYCAIFSELLCVVSKYPIKIHRNTKNDLHNMSGNAVEWGNNSELTKFECYYINGRNISSESFIKAQDNKITIQDWLSEKNEDVKAAWFEILGPEKLMKIFEAKEIDRCNSIHANGAIEQHIFYKSNVVLVEIGEPLAWITFVCPTTGTKYFISTNPNNKTAQESVLQASPFYGIEINTSEDYSFDERG